MKTRTLLWALSLLLFPTTLIAQSGDAKAIDLLDRAGEAYRRAGGISASFEIVNVEAGQTSADKWSGTALLRGDKFTLHLPGEMRAWFDGQNQWLYLEASEEVNLSAPGEEELLMINPVKVFMLYRYGYRCRPLPERQMGNRRLSGVEMSPEDPYSDVQSLMVWLDKTTLQPVSVRIVNKDASGTRIEITDYKTGQTLSDRTFVFPAQDYPGVEVIDLR